MKLAVPDLISNSYFPAVAAVALGFFEEEGLDVSLELIFPVDEAYRAMRDGRVDFVAGSAHSALAAFPEWQGAKLLCAQAQGMYWFLVMRADLGAARGDIGAVRGRRIGAAPWVEMGLKRLLIEAGIDLERDGVTIAPVPGASGATVNFGLTAAKALEEGKIDGFWANGMGTEVAVRRGVGTIVLDVRRGDGPRALLQLHDGLGGGDRAADRRLSGSGGRRGPRDRQDPGGAQSRSGARRRGRPQALSARRGGADRRADPPRSAVLRRHDLAGVCRRHEPIRARHRHPAQRGSL